MCMENLKSAIRKRRSVRTFKKRPFAEKDRREIDELMDNALSIEGPFGHKVRNIAFVEQSEKKAERIGTYGFIKHAPGFIAGVTTNTHEHLLDYGYVFEMLTLWLTERNYGTVWLGGTFKRAKFKKFLSNDDDFIPAVLGVGYAHEKHSLRDTVIRKAAKADNRKPFETLFFEFPSMQGIDRRDHPKLAKVLDMVRAAPSASNRQPWRIFLQKNTLHVYMKFDEKYNDKLSYDIQYIDMGIALSHLEIGLKTHDFTFRREAKAPAMTEPSYTYIISYKVKRHKR